MSLLQERETRRIVVDKLRKDEIKDKKVKFEEIPDMD
jgi:hypothetical protein